MATAHHVALGITQMVGLSIIKMRNAVSFVTFDSICNMCCPPQHIFILETHSPASKPRTAILPADHLVMELKSRTRPSLSMIQLKHAVADLTGLVLVLVCQPQKRVQRDH